jgi:hypothetical protein
MLKIESLYSYVSRIKQQKKIDIHSVINTTLVMNPYTTNFPKDFLLGHFKQENKFKLFIFHSVKFYLFNIMRFIFFIQMFFYYKLLYKKSKYAIFKNDLILDLFIDISRVVKEGSFSENYFSALYPILKEKKLSYVFVPRLHGLSHNPIKARKQLISFFKIINQDDNHFLFEFELFSFNNFLELIWLYLCYPFKTLRLLSKEKNRQDIVFNTHLLKDISKQSVVYFTRYILGKNISKIQNISDIYSWSEFQVVERAFNYAIRRNSDIKINACQFLVSYPVYFNMHVQDIDEISDFAPNRVLVNGSHYLLKRKEVNYQLGASLRYQKLFEYKSQYLGSNIVLLGSYFIDETMNMLKLVSNFDAVLFKGHPAIDVDVYRDSMGENIKVINENIYDLFPKTALIIGSATGSLVEAIACGVSVVVVARKNELITNPLVDMGQGKMWDIAFNVTELEQKMKKLLEFRNKNMDEIKDIAIWYKNNFFIEPSEENIVKTFELK